MEESKDKDSYNKEERDTNSYQIGRDDRNYYHHNRGGYNSYPNDGYQRDEKGNDKRTFRGTCF